MSAASTHAQPADQTGRVEPTHCPYGRQECGGVSGLYFGHLGCFWCYVDASTDAIETYAEVR